MLYALPLVAFLTITGCAAVQEPQADSWMVCIDTPEALECVVSDGGETKRIKVPHVGIEKDMGT